MEGWKNGRWEGCAAALGLETDRRAVREFATQSVANRGEPGWAFAWDTRSRRMGMRRLC